MHQSLSSHTAHDPVIKAHDFPGPSLVDRYLRGGAQFLLLSQSEVPLPPFPKWFVGTSLSLPLGCSVDFIVGSSVTTLMSPPASQGECETLPGVVGKAAGSGHHP